MQIAPLGPGWTAPHRATGGARYHEPVDSFGPSLETLARPPQKPPRSVARKLIKLAAWTGLAVTVSAASLAVIGYLGNPDLTRKPEVTVLADQNPVSNAAPQAAPGQAAAAVKPAPVRVQSDRVVVLVPRSTVSGVATQAQQNPRAQKFLAQKAREAEASLTEVLRGMKAPEGTVLLDARLPVPTGDRAFFHVGPVDLPSLGVHHIEYRSVPLVVGYRTSPLAPAFQVGLETFQAQNPPRPAGVGPDALYVGSVRVSVKPRESVVPVDGELSLAVERDGKATGRQLSELRAKLARVAPDSPRGQQLKALIARHQERLQEERDLPHAELLDAAFQDQTAAFTASVRAPAGAAARATYHVWMGRDQDQDGRADLHLAGETDFSALDGLEVKLTRLESTGLAPDGFLNRIAHEQVASIFQGAIRQALPEVTDSLRRGAIAELGSELRRGTPWVAQQGNQVLTEGYRSGLDLDVPPLAGTGGRHLHYQLNRVQTAPQGLVVELQSARGRGQAEAVQFPFQLGPGEVGLRLPGAELNSRLRDTIDWKSLLEQVRRSQKLKELQFGKGGAPRFIMEGGKPAVTFDIVARSEGAILFDARVATGIVVPLDMRTHDGKLEVKPDPKGVRMTDPQTPLPFNPIDLLPTRLLSNMIANFIAESKGAGGVAHGLTEGFDLDLDKKGLQFEEVHAQARGAGAPDLVLKLKTTPRTTDFLLRTMLDER